MSPKRFKNIRDKFGLTQVEFAKCFGLTQKTISQYEIGFRKPGPTVQVLLLLLENLSASQGHKFLKLMEEASEKLKKIQGGTSS